MIKVIIVLIFLSFSFTSCSLSNDDGNSIRLGYLQNDLHHLPVFVAIEKGFFKDENLEVEVSGIFRAGPEEMSAFGAKELDIGYVGQAPAIAAVLNRIADVKFISQVNLEGSAVVVRKESGFKKLTDLEGKIVAIPGHATMQDFLFRKALKKQSLKIEKINIIVLKPPEMIQALNMGNIDAFVAWEPYPSQAVEKNIGRVLIFSKNIWPNHPCCVLVCETGFCNKNPAIVRKIKHAHKRSCEFINRHRDEAVDIGVKYTGMNRNTVSNAVSNIQYCSVLDPKKCLEFVEYLKELRYIKTYNEENPLSKCFYE